MVMPRTCLLTGPKPLQSCTYHHAVLLPAERVQSDIDLPGTPPGLDVGARPSPHQLEEALAGIKSAGALFPGNALVYQVGAKQVGV